MKTALLHAFTKNETETNEQVIQQDQLTENPKGNTTRFPILQTHYTNIEEYETNEFNE